MPIVKRILILAPFNPESLAQLKKDSEIVYEPWDKTGSLQDPIELGERLVKDKFDAIVIEADFLFRETFETAPNILFVGVCRSSVSHVDVKAATEKGIVVVNTPGRNAQAVAELTLGLMLSAARRIVEADNFIRNKEWTSPIEAYRSMRGIELYGRTVGIVGLGAIGMKTLNLSKAFGMKTLAHDPFVSHDTLEAVGGVHVELDYLVSKSDFITLHAPPNAGVIMTAERISYMRAGGVLVNTASADLVDEAALIKALRAGKISAGIDTFGSHPLEPSSLFLKLKNVSLTPHVGGATFEVIQRHSTMMTEDLLRFKQNKKPFNMVNPEAW